MAIPAVPVFIDSSHGLSMATQTVFFDYPGVMVRNLNHLVHLSGVVPDDIVHAVDGFPEEVPGKIIVGEMAFDAGDPFMSPGVEPGFVFHL